MRAKEYIEQNRPTIKFVDYVERVINDLTPLRLDKDATVDYFNRILASDIRRQNYLLQKDLHKNNNAMQLSEPELKPCDDEYPIEIAADLRESIFEVIRDDKSFGYLFFLLGNDRNSKHPNDPVDCIPNIAVIKDSINRFRDDYPKASLDEYLDDDINYEQHNYLINNGFYNNDSQYSPDFYNDSYRIYDEVRCKKSKLSEVHKYCDQLCFDDDKKKFFEISFVCKLIETFEKDDAQLERCKKELQKFIEPLRDKFVKKEKLGNIILNPKRGFKTDFIRIVNVLCEMEFFKGNDATPISKKDVFVAFGNMLNYDFSTYQNNLNTSKISAKTDMKNNLQIFEEMLNKQKDLMGVE